MKKRLLSLLLAAVLLVSLAPTASFAEMMVYISANDKYYHSSDCERLGGSGGAVSVSMAFEEGYTPCPDCGAKDPRTAAKYAVEGGSLLFDKESGEIIGCEGDILAAAIPEEIDGVKVSSIGDWAFSGSESLVYVSIPDTVTSIGSYAFSGCTALIGADIPKTVSSIGEGAFQYCLCLESIALPEGLDKIAAFTFESCILLTDISIPKSVKSIGEGAFRYCSGLGGIVIPDAVSTIGSEAFSGCSTAAKLTLPASVKTVGEGAFDKCLFSDGLYYGGSLAQWRAISVAEGNDALYDAQLYLNGAAHKHNYTKKLVAKASCTSAGKTELSCECGAGSVVNEPAALGHDYKNGVCTRCTAADPDYKPPVKVSFVDVPSTEYYYKPVQWAVENGITDGIGNNKFAPDGTCTRGQVVTFLWRAAGKPTVSANVSFTDVKADEYYYEAVKWAVANGITQGVGGNKFAPNDTCTRGQVVTFLHRAANKPAASALSSFIDVPSGEYYYDAVSWAVGKGITQGTGGNRFAPDDICTRGQVVTFLYRAQ